MGRNSVWARPGAVPAVFTWPPPGARCPLSRCLPSTAWHGTAAVQRSRAHAARSCLCPAGSAQGGAAGHSSGTASPAELPLHCGEHPGCPPGLWLWVFSACRSEPTNSEFFQIIFHPGTSGAASSAPHWFPMEKFLKISQ